MSLFERWFARPPIKTIAPWCDLHKRAQCEHGKNARDIIGVYFGVVYFADGTSFDSLAALADRVAQ